MYNHGEGIRKTLDSILSQIPSIEDICDLEIAITDNRSTDSSPAIIQNEYLPEYSDTIKYHRNETIIEMSKNCNKAIELSTKDYAWCLGDDVLIEGSIKDVCVTIQKYKKRNNSDPNFIIVNNIRCTELGSPAVDDTLFSNKDFFYPDIYSLLKDALNTIFVLSNNIVLKDAWLKHYHNTNSSLKKFDSFHPHSDALVKIGMEDGGLIFIDRPLVGYTLGSREDNVYDELIYALGSASVISNNNLQLNKVSKFYHNERGNVYVWMRLLGKYRNIDFYMQDSVIKIVKHHKIFPFKLRFIVKILSYISTSFALNFLFWKLQYSFFRK